MADRFSPTLFAHGDAPLSFKLVRNGSRLLARAASALSHHPRQIYSSLSIKLHSRETW